MFLHGLSFCCSQSCMRYKPTKLTHVTDGLLLSGGGMGWEIFWGIKFSLTLRSYITFMWAITWEPFFNIKNGTSTVESSCSMFFSVALLGVFFKSFCCAGFFMANRDLSPPLPPHLKRTMVRLLARWYPGSLNCAHRVILKLYNNLSVSVFYLSTVYLHY